MLRFALVIFLSSIASTLIACSSNSADDRLRRILGIAEGLPIAEVMVVQQMTEMFPLGTPEPLLAERAKAAGIGIDGLSSYNLLKERNVAIIRIEFDGSTFAVAKSSWILTLQLDSGQRLHSIEARHGLTGP